MNGTARFGNTHPSYKEGIRYFILRGVRILVELVLKGVIIERLVSSYVNLLVVVRRKKVSKVIYYNAHINRIIVNN